MWNSSNHTTSSPRQLPPPAPKGGQELSPAEFIVSRAAHYRTFKLEDVVKLLEIQQGSNDKMAAVEREHLEALRLWETIDKHLLEEQCAKLYEETEQVMCELMQKRRENERKKALDAATFLQKKMNATPSPPPQFVEMRAPATPPPPVIQKKTVTTPAPPQFVVKATASPPPPVIQKRRVAKPAPPQLVVKATTPPPVAAAAKKEVSPAPSERPNSEALQQQLKKYLCRLKEEEDEDHVRARMAKNMRTRKATLIRAFHRSQIDSSQ